MVLKVYGMLGSRRTASDLREALRRGHLSREIPGLKVAVMMESPIFTPVLKALIARSATPLRAVET
jgi:hypothetical protein